MHSEEAYKLRKLNFATEIYWLGRVLRMRRALGDPFLHFAIIRGAIQKGRLFLWIVCQFSPFHWSNFDLELIYFAFIHEHLIL